MVKKSQSASDFGLAWRLCVSGVFALIFPASKKTQGRGVTKAKRENGIWLLYGPKNPTKSNLIAPNPTKSHHFETFFYGDRKQSSDPCLQSFPGCGSLPRLNFDVALFRRQLYTKWPLPVSIRWKARMSVYN
jgi:hypothetical protein